MPIRCDFYYYNRHFSTVRTSNLHDKDVGDIARKLSMIWNMYDFFTLYAEVDGWEWDGSYDEPLADLTNSLDRWIVSKVHILGETVDEYMQDYDLQSALKPILPFIDDASNWYVRRSRKRFWKSDSDQDKQDAYRTLHYVLVRLAHIMAPFTPFLAEELYQKLTDGESVHLRDWPQIGGVDEDVVEQMDKARELINTGLSIRAKNSLKVRQPLKEAVISSNNSDLSEEMLEILKEELNVKNVVVSADITDIELDLNVTPELKREGIMRDLIRHVQNARKKADLNVDDHINLFIEVEDADISQAISEHMEALQSETLADNYGSDNLSDSAFQERVKVEGTEATVRLEKI